MPHRPGLRILFTWPRTETHTFEVILFEHIEEFHENPPFGSGKDEEMNPVSLKNGSLYGTVKIDVTWSFPRRYGWAQHGDRPSIDFYSAVTGVN